MCLEQDFKKEKKRMNYSDNYKQLKEEQLNDDEEEIEEGIEEGIELKEQNKQQEQQQEEQLQKERNQNNSNNNNKIILNIVYHTTVPINEKYYFEKEWLPEMFKLYYNFNGFLHRSVNLLVQTKNVCEYLVIITCNNYNSFLEWNLSPFRVKMLEKLKLHNITTRRLDTSSDVSNIPSSQTFVNNNENNNENIDSSDTESLLKESKLHLSKAYLKDPLGKVSPSLPPPKWKLCIIIYFGVMINIYLWSYSGIPVFLLSNGIPKGLNIFISLSISVPILSYSFFPLVMSIPYISKWLRAPRSANMSSIHRLLDQGLLMFASKTSSTPSKEVVAHLKKLEYRLETTRRVQHELTTEVKYLREQLSLTNNNNNNNNNVNNNNNNNKTTKRNKTGNQQDLKEKLDHVRNAIVSDIQLTSTKSQNKNEVSNPIWDIENGKDSLNDTIEYGYHGPLTVAVAHWVKWEHIPDFEVWTEEITQEMAKFDGFLGLTTIVPTNDNEPYINCFTYDTSEHMMNFIDSENRQILLKKLEPFLETHSTAQAAKNRIIDNAFTELFVSTGEFAEVTPPPIWKSVILTVIPLHIIVWIVGGNFVKILTGKTKLQIDVITLISTILTVLVNSYIGVPLMQLQFGEWLRIETKSNNNQPRQQKDYFHFLEVGFNRTQQIFIFLCWSLFNILFGVFQVIK